MLNDNDPIGYLFHLREENAVEFEEYANLELLPFVCKLHQKLYSEEFLICDFHYELADLLTRCALRQIDCPIVIINMPPRFSKTQFITYYIAWCFVKNEMARFLYVTYSDELSLKTSRDAKTCIALCGKKSKISKDSAKLWQTKRGGELLATTINGTATGFGAGDLYATPYGGDLIIDDPQKPQDAFYETMLINVQNALKNTFFSRRNNFDKIPIILIQQRLHPMDLSGWIIKESKLRYIRLVVKALNDKGESNFPARVSKESLLELKESAPYTFQAQQQQEPQAFSGNHFLTEKITLITQKEFREREQWINYWVRSWDFAGVRKDTKNKGTENRDWTRGVLMCTDGTNVYITDMKSHRGTVDQNDTLLVKAANHDSWRTTITIPVDPGVGGEHYVDYLQSLPQLSGYTLNPIKPTQNKQLRSAPFASFLNQGKVVIVSDENDEEKWNMPLMEELASFPYGQHDDAVDACSDCFHMIHSVHRYV